MRSLGRLLGLLASVAAAAVPAAPTQADGLKRSLHGIALGMTLDEARAATELPCSLPAYSSDLTCHDAADGADYTAMMSAGTPSVVLTVARSFCSHDAPAEVLDRTLKEFRAPRTATGADPNGFHIDLDGTTEAILNADDGTCPEGRGKHYVLSLRDNSLITTESDRAMKRVKDAMH